MRYSRMRQLADMSLPELRAVLIRDIRKIPNARVKKLLLEYQQIQTRIDSNLDQIQVLRSRLQRITVVYKDAPGGGPQSDRSILVGKIKQLESFIQADADQMKNALLLVRSMIDSLDNRLERRVLELRYIRGWGNWQRIADELNYTESYMKNGHGNALRKLIPLSEKILMSRYAKNENKVQKSTVYCDIV